jgi:hypothetical protein
LYLFTAQFEIVSGLPKYKTKTTTKEKGSGSKKKVALGVLG